MKKKFNDVGLCVPGRHYMVDISGKIDQIVRLVDDGAYFVISRPRQFGKTTTLSLLARRLNQRDDCIALKISFEEIDSDTFRQQESFVQILMDMIAREFAFLNLPDLSAFFNSQTDAVRRLPDLSKCVTRFLRDVLLDKSLVLLIDEVDKSSNNQLFLDFLGMLRNKYLLREEGRDLTFQSVALAGVHDVKTLKTKIRDDDERRFNSPWNIAVDFKVDMSFSPSEIETMLRDYSQNKRIDPDIPNIADKLHYYTSGYPYLVSKLCKFIDEDIAPGREEKTWRVDDVDAAFRMVTDGGYTTTLFDSLVKNLENDSELNDLVFRITINGEKIPFSIADPVTNLGSLFGIVTPSDNGLCRIHNRIFEQRTYEQMVSKAIRKQPVELNGFNVPNFYTEKGLNIKLILQHFQKFMKEHCSGKDAKFLEREGRLLFLSYLRPIINGKGFDFKEPIVGDERRMDIVVTCQGKRHVIELKIWRGSKYHQAGLEQLSRYLDSYSLEEGYLLIYNFNKKKEYKQEEIVFKDKHILAIWV